MEGRINQLANDQEDYENSPENSGDLLPSGTLSDHSKMTSTSSPRKRFISIYQAWIITIISVWWLLNKFIFISRRAMQKRVVSVPIREVDGSRLKGEITSTPPSDSWAWRKYGQKPIKGSPHPRFVSTTLYLNHTVLYIVSNLYLCANVCLLVWLLES